MHVGRGWRHRLSPRPVPCGEERSRSPVLGRRRMWDEDTVGTFSDLGLEDERTVKDENFQVALEDVDINVSVRAPRGDGEELSQIQVQKPSRQPPGQGPG
ncbi:mucin-3A [Panthera pardus]|uniref:Mucin-3A n=1 Tax=Panthera pardus TaxID=9691 RepID=A0A9W2UTX1_PANPR|nr:mucin-3A [Panthera pardus]